MQPQFAEINGAACRYLLSGEGPRTLVLVHELGGSLNSWDALVPMLPAGWRVLRHDLRGAGMSEKPAGPLGLDLLADDVAALVAHAGIDGPVALAGAAMGAAVAVRCATRHRALVEKLVLVAPALGVPAERRQAAIAIADGIEREGMRAIAGAVLPKAFPDHLWSSPAEKARIVARWLGADPQGYAAAYRVLVAEDARPELASIACPTLVVAGRHDPFAAPEALEQSAAAIPGGRFAIVEGGHFLAVQTPALVAEALGPLLSGD